MRGLNLKQNSFSLKAVIMPLFFFLFAIFSCFTYLNFFHSNSKINFANASSIADTVQDEVLPTEYSLYKVNAILNNFDAVNRTENCADLPQNVGNQRGAGICWAFSSLTAFESSLYKAEVVDFSANLNFSELHLAYTTQVLNRGDKKIGGGTFVLANEYLSSEQGPYYEQDGEFVGDDFWDSDLLATTAYQTSFLQTAEKANFAAFETFSFPSRSSLNTNTEVLSLRNSIKNHIKTYGAVSAAIYYDKTALIENVKQNNTNPETTVNHNVALVGWDDNFSYTIANGTTYTGAYIAQNSHGTDFGYNGYFYIMYDDCKVEEAVSGFIRVGQTSESFITYNNLKDTTYNNQFLTDTGSGYSWGNPVIANQNLLFANIYKTTEISNQFISRIKVPTVSYDNATTSKFYVYVLTGLTEEDVASTEPIKDCLTQKFSYATKIKNLNSKASDEYLYEAQQITYYTVELDQSIYLDSEYFAIFVEYISGPVYAKANENKNDGLLSRHMTYLKIGSGTWGEYLYDDMYSITHKCILPMFVMTEYVLGTIDYTVSDVEKVYDGQYIDAQINVSNLSLNEYKIVYSLDDINWADNLQIKNVGDYTVHFKILSNFYKTVKGSFKAKILPKQIKVKPTFQYKYYGNDDGNINNYKSEGEIEEAKFSGYLLRQQGENVGLYDINIGTLKLVDDNNFIASNYTLVLEESEGKFEIRPRPLYIVAKQTFKVYGETDTNIYFDYTNAYSTEKPNFEGSLTRESGEDVGKYNVIQNNLKLVSDAESGFDINNYTLVFNSQNNVNKFEITPRSLIVTPKENIQKIYGEADPTFEYKYSNALNGQVPVFEGTLSREVGEDVGAYNYTLGSLQLVDNNLFLAKNYKLKIDDTSTQFVINYGTLSGCTVESKTVYYNGDYFALNAISNVVSDVKICYSINNVDFIQGNIQYKDAGNYLVYYKFEKQNYNSIVLSANLTIKPYNLFITPNENQSKIYGDIDPIITFTDNHTIQFEEPEFTGTLSREQGEDVGSYIISRGNIALKQTENLNPQNYNVIFSNQENISFKIVKRQVVVCPLQNQFKKYGFEDPTLTFNYTNVVGSEKPTFLGALNREVGEDVGNYEINLGTLEISNNAEYNFKASNYTLEFCQHEHLFQIKKADIIVSVIEVESYYGDPVVTQFESNISGEYVSGDQLDISYSCQVDAFTLKGIYALTAKVQNEKANKNYNITINHANYIVKYKTYEVNFVVLNKVIKTIYVEHFAKIETQDVPIVEQNGYTFKNWQIVEDDFSYIIFDTENDVITCQTNLRASMQIATYTVYLHTNNNQTLTQTYTIKSSTFDLIVPKKQGYTFAGWYQNSNFEGESVASIEKGSFGDKNYFAKWIINTYKVYLPQSTEGYSISYDDSLTKEYGTSFEFSILLDEAYSKSLETLTIRYTEGEVQKTPTSLETLTFVIENISDDIVINIENVTINIYSINFIIDNQIFETLYREHGKPLSYADYPQLPSKENYDQKTPTWSLDRGFSEVKQDYDIVAEYTPNVYEVKVVTQDGKEVIQLITYGQKLNEETLRTQLDLNVFEYLVFEQKLNEIDSDVTIFAKVESNIYILYIVLGCVAGVTALIITLFVIRKIKRRKFNWWGYTSDTTKLNKK